MDYASILTAINAALPLGFTLIHLITDSKTGDTAVIILERTTNKAQSTENVIKAWNDLHPAPVVQPGQTPKV